MATPDKSKKRSISPVLGGSSYASQHSLVQSFGLGKAKKAVVEVLWPGGVRNRLYDVAAGEHVVLPEIPCNFAGNWSSKHAYEACVNSALATLQSGGVINATFANRLRKSAVKAYREAH